MKSDDVFNESCLLSEARDLYLRLKAGGKDGWSSGKIGEGFGKKSDADPQYIFTRQFSPCNRPYQDIPECLGSFY